MLIQFFHMLKDENELTLLTSIFFPSFTQHSFTQEHFLYYISNVFTWLEDKPPSQSSATHNMFTFVHNYKSLSTFSRCRNKKKFPILYSGKYSTP
jgi:hypothetical protein